MLLSWLCFIYHPLTKLSLGLVWGVWKTTVSRQCWQWHTHPLYSHVLEGCAGIRHEQIFHTSMAFDTLVPRAFCTVSPQHRTKAFLIFTTRELFSSACWDALFLSGFSLKQYVDFSRPCCSLDKKHVKSSMQQVSCCFSNNKHSMFCPWGKAVNSLCTLLLLLVISIDIYTGLTVHWTWGKKKKKVLCSDAEKIHTRILDVLCSCQFNFADIDLTFKFSYLTWLSHIAC